MKLNTTDIRLESKHLGEIVWVCSYNKPDANKKPLRNVPPTKCKVVCCTNTNKRVYYSNTYFAPLKKDGESLTKKVISPVDNTGYRMRAGNEIDVYTTEEEAVKAYQEQYDSCHPPTPLTEAEIKLGKVKDVIKLAEEWCIDQSNGLSEGSVCMSALRDIRRIIKDGEK